MPRWVPQERRAAAGSWRTCAGCEEQCLVVELLHFQRLEQSVSACARGGVWVHEPVAESRDLGEGEAPANSSLPKQP